MARVPTKGSEEEIDAMRGKYAEKGKEWGDEVKMRRPRYLIFDFETGTHTGAHVPNRLEAAVIEVD